MLTEPQGFGKGVRMIVYASGRQYGKTRALLAWLATEPHAYVMVSTYARKEQLLGQIRQTPLARLGRPHWEHQILVAENIGRPRRLFGPIAIEDFDDVVRAMWGPAAHLEFVTMTATTLLPDQWSGQDEEYLEGEEAPVWDAAKEIEVSKEPPDPSVYMRSRGA
jgi:hypothetical protein